ncbi:MAG: hypothetical protein WA061_01865 [Microgenomates group bacterium]
MRDIELEIENARDNYLQKIEDIANDVFEEYVKPYFQKNKIHMQVGGGWGAIYYKEENKKHVNLHTDDFPENVSKFLNMEYDGRFTLDMSMSDFHPE